MIAGAMVRKGEVLFVAVGRGFPAGCRGFCGNCASATGDRVVGRWVVIRRAGYIAGLGWGVDDGAMEQSWAVFGFGLALDVGKALASMAGMVMFAVMVTAWCLFVLVLTGRLPWFARKYF